MSREETNAAVCEPIVRHSGQAMHTSKGEGASIHLLTKQGRNRDQFWAVRFGRRLCVIRGE